MAHRRSRRARIESAFGRLGGRISRHPWRYITVMLGLTLSMVAYLPSIRIDSSFVGMLPSDDPARIAFKNFRDVFGSPENAVLSVRPSGELFSRASIARLAALHDDLENEMPRIAEIDSLMNARDVRSVDGSIVTAELLDEWPEDSEGWRALALRARANPLFADLFVSRSGHRTLFVLEPDIESGSQEIDLLGGFSPDRQGRDRARGHSMTTEEVIEINDALEGIIAKHRSPDLEILTGGGIPMSAVVAKGIERDFGLLLGLAFGLIALLLYAAFRSLSIVVLALTVVLLSLVSTLGMMAATGTPIDVGTQILPALLLAVGVGYSVHVLTIFSHRRIAGVSRGDAISESLAHTGLAVTMTALTTMAGFGAFAVGDLVLLQRIGMFAPAGVLLCAIYSLILLPALLVVLPISPPTERAWLLTAQNVCDRIARFAVERRYAILFGLGALLIIAAFGVMRVRVSHNPLHWLPEDTEFRIANRILEEDFGGAYQLELLVEMRDGHTLREPRVLQAMADFASEAADLQTPHVKAGQVVGLHDVVFEVHQALHDGAPEERRIDDDPNLVVQELLLFETGGLDDLLDYTDLLYQTARIGVRVNYADAHHVAEFADRIDSMAERLLGPYAQMEITGLFAISQRMFTAFLDGMIESYVIAAVVISSMMMLMIGRLREGLAALIPNLVPIFLTLGIMGFMNIPLGLFTMLVGNLALGLAVDDTIHVVHGYIREQEKTDDPVVAFRRVFSTTGTALVVTTLALVVGFAVFSSASLVNLRSFGVLASTAIGLALIADLLVAPALMVVVRGGMHSENRGQPRSL